MPVAPSCRTTGEARNARNSLSEMPSRSATSFGSIPDPIRPLTASALAR